MARFIRFKKDAIGQSPDSTMFRGVKKTDETKIRIIDYSSDTIDEKEVAHISESLEFGKNNTVTWLNIDGLHDTQVMQELAISYNIDPLIISDILNPDARPKIHEYNECIYISVKLLRYNEQNGEILSENLVLLVTDKQLISVQEVVGDVFNPVRERLRKNRKRIRSANSDYLAFALLDVIIDNYIHIISRIGEEIEGIDDDLINNPSANNLEEIKRLKSEITFARKSIKPCREIIFNLIKLDSDLVNDGTVVHLKELQNNIEHANELIDSYREVLSDQLNIFHTNVSYRLNDILKFLTIFSVIFIPITFIAGIYGTNFDNIPELHYKYGYFVMWGVIIISVVSMIFYFKKKKWL